MNLVHSTRQPLDIRQLRAFVALAKSGSFTRAGLELCVSQSAVSHSIKGLEADTGCRLFDRLGKKVHLTPAGEHLLHHAMRILREMALARGSIEQRASWGKGSLRIAAAPTICQHLLPSVLQEFQSEVSQVQISIETCESVEWAELFRENRLDLALGVLPLPEAGHSFTPLFSDEPMVVVAAKHPWAKLGQAPLEEFSEQTLLLDWKLSVESRMVLEYFERERIRPGCWVELGSVESVKAMVELDLGVSLLPVWLMKGELARGTHCALSLGRKKLKREWGVIRPLNRSEGLGEATLIKLLKRHGLERFAMARSAASAEKGAGRE